MKLILASKNAHKAAEMQAILGDSIELITQDAAGCGEKPGRPMCPPAKQQSARATGGRDISRPYRGWGDL